MDQAFERQVDDEIALSQELHDVREVRENRGRARAQRDHGDVVGSRRGRQHHLKRPRAHARETGQARRQVAPWRGRLGHDGDRLTGDHPAPGELLLKQCGERNVVHDDLLRLLVASGAIEVR